MTDARRRRRPLAGSTAAWREAGAGPPLVLVHGAGGSADLWAPQFHGLADVARVVAPDLPGHGRAPGRGKPSIAAYAEWLGTFLGTLRAGRAVVVGHSMGGAVAQALALHAPGRLAGLVLIGTGAKLRVLPRLVDLLRERPREGQSLIQDLAFAAGTPRECGEVVDRVLRQGAPLVTLGDYLACDRFDVRSELARIRLPTLVVAGAEDRLTPPTYARFLADRIPGARLVEIPDAGHFPQLEQPRAVNAAIREFLAGLGAGAAGDAEATAAPP